SPPAARSPSTARSGTPDRAVPARVTVYCVTITLAGVTLNPFVYGEVVPAAAFVDRIDELDRLVRDLEAAQKVFLISPRRYGKSSLIRRALAAVARRGAITVDVTVSRSATSSPAPSRA